jgi:hypothetical protein
VLDFLVVSTLAVKDCEKGRISEVFAPLLAGLWVDSHTRSEKNFLLPLWNRGTISRGDPSPQGAQYRTAADRATSPIRPVTPPVAVCLPWAPNRTRLKRLGMLDAIQSRDRWLTESVLLNVPHELLTRFPAGGETIGDFMHCVGHTPPRLALSLWLRTRCDEHD